MKGASKRLFSGASRLTKSRDGNRSVHEMPASRLRALIRDFTELLGQQMYLWGRDVIHPRGNLLCENGFDRRKSEGLEGTSCYRKHFEDGCFIELHGACAGFYDPSAEKEENFIYIRNRKRCFVFSDNKPPAPGIYANETLHCGPAVGLYFASLRFLDWWLEYENWIARETAIDWRDKGYAAFSSLPASRPSLSPREAQLWLTQYRNNPAAITRARERMRALKS